MTLDMVVEEDSPAVQQKMTDTVEDSGLLDQQQKAMEMVVDSLFALRA
jgi:hypothetical protein